VDALVALLLEEAEQRPVLAVWEDLHWADPSTIDLLSMVIEQTPTAPILNLLTFRPGFTPPWPQRSHMTPLTLNRLERPEVKALIGQHTGGKPLPKEVLEHIIGKTDGVPLYVEELSKAILEADFLREQNGGYQLTGPMSGLAIPATLQDSLMARLDRLPNIREVAQLGSVLGREFIYEMVEAIASTDAASLQNGLDKLVAAELLYQRGRPPRAKYIFKHALVQDAAYQSLLKRTRQYYHGQVAELLEGRYPELVQTQPELIAHHCTEAGLGEQAVKYWHEAGRQALRRSANLEAVGHLRKELEVLMTLAESAERDSTELALQTSLGAVLMTVKGYGAPEVGVAYGRANELCATIDDKEKLFPVLWGIAAYHMIRAEHATALAGAKQLFSLTENLSETPYLLEGHLMLGFTSSFVGELQVARENFEEVQRLYDAEQHAALALSYGGFDPGMMGLAYLAWTLWLLGDVEQAVARTDQAQALIRGQDNPYILARVLTWDAIIRQYVGDWRTVRARADEAVALADEHGFELVAPAGNIMSGWSRIQRGESAEGAAQVRRGVDAYRATGSGFNLPYYLIPLAEAARDLGQPEHGLEVLSEALARLRRSQERPAEAHDLLASVHGRFTEGFDSADLKEAKALLEELS
jgi:predicted ATPase